MPSLPTPPPGKGKKKKKQTYQRITTPFNIDPSQLIPVSAPTSKKKRAAVKRTKRY
jgi:hypothetical protein